MAMHFFDKKLAGNKARYVLQCLLAAVSMFVILLVLDAENNGAIIGALGASVFIAFTMPKRRVARARYLVGGHVIGVVAGVLCHRVSQCACWQNISMVPPLSTALFGALSVGLAIFLMVATDREHPPAAGVALGLVLNGYNSRTILVILVGIIVLTLVKRLLRPLLIDLL